jgi:anti-anti-sigma factor
MDDRRFVAQVVSIPDEVRLSMRGDLDGRAEEAIDSAYADVDRLGSPRLTLDFTDVGYINSTGIALVVRLLTDARRGGRAVRAIGLSPHYREIFRITRLSDFMDIVEGDAA